MNQHDTILVGVDFSSCSASALRQAIRIAGWNQAKVKVVNVVDMLMAIDINESMGVLSQGIVTELIQNSQDQWAAFAKQIPGAAGLPFEVEVNSAVAALSRRASELAAGLVVLGISGVGAKNRAGPIAAGCVRRAPTDVLLVQDGHVKPYTTVVVGIDFSDTSRRALDQAIRVALQDDASLYVVHAYTSPWGGALTATPSADLEEKYREMLLARLEAFAKPLAHELGYLKAQFQLIEHVSHGHGIGVFAAQIGADLVTVGKRGRTNLRDMFLGSTAERVLRDAPCSVLAVRGV